ncbi:MAG TPA: glycosyltransferase [Steroidobacteraceae bacterium]|nr:glycosyltransferase [Steroidobacteraceae bacterium]
MHLVDTTLFFSPTSGGVRRYLTAKHAWLRAHTLHRHSLLVPGTVTELHPGDVSTIAGWKVPGTFNYRLPLSPRRWVRMLDALEPDLIEVGDVFHPAWCAMRSARRRDIPLLAFFHSNFPRLAGRRLGRIIEAGLAQYLRRVYERVDLVLAPSRQMCDYLAGLGLRNTALQPLGVDVDIFSPQRRSPGLRRTLGLADDTRLLVYAGRFSAEKNIDVLHGALQRLGGRYHLLMLGGGEYARPAPNISVQPYRRDSVELASMIASCDALVHAGCSETFGLVIIEALACGIPVVGANAGAVPEHVDESVGMLAPPGDAAGMAAAIAALYERDLAALGRAARERALQRYTWTRALQLLLGHYAAVAGAALAPDPEQEPLELPLPH